MWRINHLPNLWEHNFNVSATSKCDKLESNDTTRVTLKKAPKVDSHEKICKHDWLKQHSKKQTVPLYVRDRDFIRAWRQRVIMEETMKTRNSLCNETRHEFPFKFWTEQISSLLAVWTLREASSLKKLSRFHLIDLLKEIDISTELYHALCN